MPIPEIGQPLPDFTLNAYNSGTAYHLSALAAQSPVLVAFFKQSCVTSNMTLPFIERLHKNYPALAVIGVSQDDEADTTAMVTRTGVTFPVVRDDGWQVSAACDLFTVPTVFLVDTEGAVRRVNMGWNKAQYSELSGDIAGLLGATAPPLFTEADNVPAFKPG